MSTYQPKTGEKCGCRRGVQRDNCAQCEGTGWIIDFAAIRARMKTNYEALAGEHGSNLRFEQWKAERAAVHNYADQRAVLDCKPLRGLRAIHECGGLYVIVRECPHAPDGHEVIAENLTAEHARQICEAVNAINSTNQKEP